MARSLSAEVTFKSSGNGEPQTERRIVQFKRPNLWRIETLGSDGKPVSVNLSDGKSVWAYRPGGKSADRRAAPESMDGPLPGANPFLQTAVLRAGDFAEMAQRVEGPVRYAGDEQIDGTSYRVLEAKGPLETARWLVGTDDLVHRIVVEARLWSPSGKEFRQRDETVIKDLKLNVPLADRAFVADVGPSVTVRDLEKNPDPLSAVEQMIPAGSVAPDFDLELVGGGRLRLSDAAKDHKAVLIYVWNVDCGACYYTLPHLQRMMRYYGYSFPMAYDPGMVTKDRYALKGWGRGILIDPDRRVAWSGHVFLADRPSPLLQSALAKVGVKHAARGSDEAQQPVEWTASLAPADARAGESAQVVVTARIAPGWHIYALGQRQSSTRVRLPGDQDFVQSGDAVGPEPTRTAHGDTLDGTVSFVIPIRIANGVHGERRIGVEVAFQACTTETCLIPRTLPINTSFSVAPGAAREDRLRPRAVAPTSGPVK